MALGEGRRPRSMRCCGVTAMALRGRGIIFARVMPRTGGMVLFRITGCCSV